MVRSTHQSNVPFSNYMNEMNGVSHDETKIEEKKLEEVIFLALGETSALFMSKDVRGTEIVMPSEKLEVIGDRILHFAKQYAEHYANQREEVIRKQTIEECKEKLDWTTWGLGLTPNDSDIIDGYEKALTELE